MNDHPSRHLLLALTLALLTPFRTAAQVQVSPPPPTPSTQPTRSQPLAVPPGTFLGGVPTGEVSPTAQKITVVGAIQKALEHNLGVLTAEQSLGKAEGAHWRTLSELLPNLNGRVSETRQTLNLAAFGFGSDRRFSVRRHSPDRRAVQRLRRARLPVAVGARLRRDQQQSR